MRATPFYLAYLMPASALAGYQLGGIYTFLTIFLAFIIIPIFDRVIGPGPDVTNPTPEETEELARKLSFRLVTLIYVPVQVALVIWGAHIVTHATLSTLEWMGLILSTGVTTSVGITVAHELCHKRNLLEKTLGKILLMTVSYMHFYIEHLIGHHVNVCTPVDPATARLGESFYAFYPRTVIGSFRSAWKIEMGRLKKAGHAKWSYHNQMLWFIALPILFAGALGMAFGWKAIPYFFAQSLIAFSILEAVNYLEHYGLVRREIAPGHYEKVTIMHAWNSAHCLTNYFVFKLQRHADHHVHPLRRYQTLHTFDDSPLLPTGYPSMILLALIPPLWRRVMDPRVEAVCANWVNERGNSIGGQSLSKHCSSPSLSPPAMDVYVARRSETLDQRNGTGCGSGALESGFFNQKCCNNTVDDSQYRREQLGMGANRKRSGIGKEITHCTAVLAPGG